MNNADSFKMQNAVRSGRSMLLALVILSAVNIFTVLLNMDIYFPLSIFTTFFGTVLYSEQQLLFALIIGIAVLVIFGAMYIISLKHYVGLVLATVFYVIDSALMFFLMADNLKSILLDIGLHTLALGVMIYGIVMAVRLLKLTPESSSEPETFQPEIITIKADTPETDCKTANETEK